MNNNLVIIGGRLTRDPEIKYTSGGKTVASFTLAINHSKEKVSFIDCNAWEGFAEFLTQYKKGNYIKIAGSIYQQSWTDKSGMKKSKVVITATEIIKVFTEKKTSTEPKPYNPPKQAPKVYPEVDERLDDYPDLNESLDESGDVPF